MTKKTILFLAVLILLGVAHAWSAACTPTGNTIVCGVADDYMSIFINGVQVGATYVFRFVDVNCPTEGPAWGVCPNPVCVTVPSSSLNLTGTGDVLAARVQNATGHEAWGSWTVDIDCGGGNHSYMVSDGTNTQLLYQAETGTAPACTSTAPSGWQNTTFTPTGWVGATVANGFTDWSKPLYSTLTGLPIPVLSDKANANHENMCEDLYYRNTFSLNAVPTPPPPNITIVKSWVGTSGLIPSGASATVSFALNICNSGGPVTTGGVTMLDNSNFFSSSFGQFQGISIISSTCDGLGCNPDAGGWYYDFGGNGGVTMVNKGGFPGATWSGSAWVAYCIAVTVAAENSNVQASQACSTYTNMAQVAWPSNTVSSNTIAITMACLPPTFTPTVTSTPCTLCTSTPSFTPTYSPTPLPWSACTATSVQVCGVADDYMTIWVNGVKIGVGNDFRFVHVFCALGDGPPWSVCPTPVCVTSTDPTLLASITSTGGGTIAAEVQNAQGHDVFGSWLMDITCSSGNHVYVDSNGANTKAWSNQGTGNAPACAPSTAPPVTSGNWYDNNATITGAWNPATVVLAADLTGGYIWTKTVIDPYTGQSVPVLSYNASAGEDGLGQSSCGLVYLSQSFTVNPVTPPPPPNITIVKSWVGTPGLIPINAAASVSFALNICNTGGPITTGAVTMLDNSGFFSASQGQFQGTNIIPSICKGLFCTSDANGALYDWGAGATIIWSKGMPGADFATGGTPYCIAVTVVAENSNVQASQACSTYTNMAQVAWRSSSVNSNTIAITIQCPPTPSFTLTYSPTQTYSPTPFGTITTPTATFTPYTPTPSYTWSLTPSPTPSWTETLIPTASWTFTSTPTATPSATRTPTASTTASATASPSATASGTPTTTNNPTPSSTLTPTASLTASATGTPSPSPSPSGTPSASPSRTPTNSLTPTGTASETPSASPSFTPTQSPTQTPTPTPTPTLSVTPTWTPSWTATFTRTNSSTPTPLITPTWTSTWSPTTTRTITASPTGTWTPVGAMTPTATQVPGLPECPPVQVSAPYPNPIRDYVQPIQVDLTSPCPKSVDWRIMTLACRVVARGTAVAAGKTTVIWDQRDLKGSFVSDGLYYFWIKESGLKPKWFKILVLR